MINVTSITVEDFLQNRTSIGRREDIEKELNCFICRKLIVTPLSTGQERMLMIDKTGWWAVCSEECFNMLVLQNI